MVTNVLLSVGVWLPMSCCPWVRGYQCLAVRGCLLSVATQPPIAAPNQRRVPQPPIADPQRRISQPTIAAHQSAPCPDGTRIYQKPTASSEGAQLWDKHHLTLSWFRKAGPTIILNIIVDASVPLRGTIFRWRCRTYPQLRCFAACSGFHDIGPAPRNSQL